MKRFYLLLFTSLFSVFLFGLSEEANAQKKKKKPSKFDYIFTITTDFGEIRLVLFDETPMHKENFLKLVQEGFYDGTAFHRVLDNFMIQGGDPNSKEGNEGVVGTGGPGYTIDAEIIEGLKHDQGMLAAARQGDTVNPERKSSGSQFYIVENGKGAHHLDSAYTIFGKVIKGMEVVEKIAEQKVDRKGKPSEPIYMNINYIKLKKKQMTKLHGITYPSKKKKKK